MRLGFVGTGVIAEAMVEGLKGSALAGWPIILSPRNAGIAQGLAGRLPGVRVAADNQAVVDESDMVVLSVLPQAAEAVVRALRFRDGQEVLSLLGGVPHARLREWIDADVTLTRAVPLPFVASRSGITPVLPPNPKVAEIFDALGTAIQTDSVAEYDLYAIGSGVMGTYFGQIEAITGWMQDQGLPRGAAELYQRSLFTNLGRVLANSAGLSLEELRVGHSTKGGFNETMHRTFVDEGGHRALRMGLSTVHARFAGK